MNLRAGNC